MTTTYSYDPADNLTQVKEGAATTEDYTYDPANQITNPGYTYDPNGNLTSDGTKTCTYDAFDRLVEVREDSTVLAARTGDWL